MGILFHRHLRRQLIHTLNEMRAQSTDAQQIAAIDQVLGSEEGLAQLSDKVEGMAADNHVQGLLEAADPNQPHQRGAIFQWLWAHRQEILQFVVTIASALAPLLPKA